ncbi:MAG TPA: hypothetical protein VEK76_13165, partial [Candidatus Binatia bacterium]|nr:hypothetical protein [Candidatus Binatia bacterium]
MCEGEMAGLSGEMGGDLADLRAAVERYAAGLRAGRDPEEHRQEMIGLRRVMDRLELAFAGMTAALGSFDEVEWQGDRSPVEWVRHQCHTWGPVATDAYFVGMGSVNLEASTRATLAGR